MKNETTEQSINRLLNTKRLESRPFGSQNSLKGLYSLIKDTALNENTEMVEVGSFCGISSELFALHVKKITCVDLWASYGEIDQPELTEAEKTFDKLTLEYPNILKVKSDSVLAAKNFADKSLDFVYIDASHAYEDVKKDILAWKLKVKDGGIIAGHDISFSSVLKAVEETLRYPDKTYEDTSWLIKL